MKLTDIELSLILASLQSLRQSNASTPGLDDLYKRVDDEISFGHKNPDDFMVNLNLEWKQLQARHGVIQRERDHNVISDAKFKEEYSRIQAGYRELIASMKHGPEAWRLCGSQITFQAPPKASNYDIDEAGKQQFPYMRWDSESGQGFVNMNEQFVTEVTNWLIAMGCDEIEQSQPEWHWNTYVNDPAISAPVPTTD